MAKEHFEATFGSLYNYKCPDWFREVKFGIWSHWGPQSVPMFGDWYARNMYIQGTPQYNYHLRHYGHPSKFGYKDLCALWKAEKFDPDALMEKYYNAGARYFVSQASHHDNFFNYDSKVNRFNSVNVGPGKDICMMWKKAAQKYNMPFGISEHLGASYSWWRVNKGFDEYGPYAGVKYDGADKKLEFYHDNNYTDREKIIEWPLDRWLTDNKKFRDYWLKAVTEMIDVLKPDLLYSDSALPFYERKIAEGKEDYDYGLKIVSHLYNTSIEEHGFNNAVYTQKDDDPKIYTVGILDYERSQMNEIGEHPWQTDTCIGGWFYDSRQTYLKPGHIIEMLTDIISKNGTMLLNILQRPDGTIDEEADWILSELAKWFSINGEAVYGSRPYTHYCEGTSNGKIEAFKEDRIDWNEGDFRFVVNDNDLYAFVMCPRPGKSAVIRTVEDADKIRRITLLGHGEVEYNVFNGVINVKMPEKLPTEYVNTLKIEY